MLQTVNGLVLRQVLLSILTNNGITEAFVNGANRKNTTLQSAAQPLCYSQFVIFENRGSRSINQAVPIELFFELTNDIERLSLAQYLCELALALVSGQDHNDEPLRLMLNALHLLSKNKREPEQIKAIAELRLMSLSGFMPDVLMCAVCGSYEHERMYFLPDEGRIVCAGCFKGTERSCELNRSALTAMRHIVLSPTEKIFSFRLGPGSQKLLSDASEAFLLAKTRRNFAALEFYKSMKRDNGEQSENESEQQ